MSRTDANSFDLVNMRFLHSSPSMDDIDCSLAENLLLRRTSHTKTFTLTSSYSTNLFNHQTTTSTSTSFHSRTLSHSHSLVLSDRPRRPTIENPYELLPNLQILNDWMITTTGKSRRELSEVHGFSEEQIAVFEESFSLLDKDGDGNISNDEIRSLMNSLGYSPSEEDISTVISKVDTNGNGSVDFDEFLTMMRRRRSTGESDSELHQVFKVFDKNKDGFIDKDELYDMLSRLGEHITEEDIREMIEEADCLDHDGKVSYEEFKAILYSR